MWRTGLPNEILCIVGSILSGEPGSRSSKASRLVCKSWASAIAEGTTKLSLGRSSEGPGFFHLFRNAEYVSYSTAPVDLKGLRELPRLRRLFLPSCTDDMLADVRVEWLELLSGARITSAGLIGKLTFLARLDLVGCKDLTGHVKLKGEDVPALQTLNLSSCCNLTRLDVRGSTAMRHLDLRACARLERLGLVGVAALASVNLSDCHRFESFRAVRTHAISHLDMSNCYRASDLRLRNFRALRSLVMVKCYRVTRIRISNLSALELVDFRSCDNLAFLGLTNLPSLKRACAADCDSLERLETARLPALSSLDLSGCYALAAIDNLRELTALRSLSLGNCHALVGTALAGIGNLYNLEALDVDGCGEVSEAVAKEIGILPGLCGDRRAN